MNSIPDFGDLNLEIPENAAVIPLTRGKFAIVDACYYELLNQWSWHFALASVKKEGGYARRGAYMNGKTTTVIMHRQIYSIAHDVDLDRSQDVDHINRNPLDNRVSNLRLASRLGNIANSEARHHNTSGYKGVKKSSNRSNKWVATIGVDGKNVGLGYFDSPEEAALAYNEAAKNIFGEFAFLNVVEGVTEFKRRIYRNSKEYKAKGVCLKKQTSRWQAYAKNREGKRKHIGYFATEEEAIEAREKYLESISENTA